ncbi:ATP-binding protein [Spirillospora sp. NPDC047279]|uniref:ATP-binding protein n=1 Tax=Spirillospora sp. NPDC047279 TaxID=3155478 RepID=UPI00340C3728
MHSTPIPESADLPERLEVAVRALVEAAGCVVSFTVLPEPESVTEARHFALSRLTAWDLPTLSDDVGLVVSELVTNALRHSGHTGERYGRLSDPLRSAPSAIRLRLMHKGPWLLCGIMDASTSAPRRKEPDYIAETGRGLHLVESFCTRWGWRGLPGGKVVWALFRAPS